MPNIRTDVSLAVWRSKTILLKLTYVLASDVSVELIASFNKMKALSKEVGLVVQAMLRSPMLEVSAIVDTTRVIVKTILLKVCLCG